MPSSTDARNANVGLNLAGKTAAVAGGSQSSSSSPPDKVMSLTALSLIPYSPGDRRSSRTPIRPSWRKRLHHREERTTRPRGRRKVPGTGARRRRRQDVRIHQGGPLVSPSLHLKAHPWIDHRGRRRSVSEVRRVAEVLKEKSGSKGIDYLVTSQGQSPGNPTPLPSHGARLASVPSLVAPKLTGLHPHPSQRRPAERQVHPNLVHTGARRPLCRPDPLPLRSRVPPRLVRDPERHVGLGVRPGGRKGTRTGRRQPRVGRRASGQVDAREGDGSGEAGLGARGRDRRGESASKGRVWPATTPSLACGVRIRSLFST